MCTEYGVLRIFQGYIEYLENKFPHYLNCCFWIIDSDG